jgi:hypothetical protein
MFNSFREKWGYIAASCTKYGPHCTDANKNKIRKNSNQRLQILSKCVQCFSKWKNDRAVNAQTDRQTNMGFHIMHLIYAFRTNTASKVKNLHSELSCLEAVSLLPRPRNPPCQRRGRVVGTPALYLGHPRFISHADTCYADWSFRAFHQ